MAMQFSSAANAWLGLNMGHVHLRSGCGRGQVPCLPEMASGPKFDPNPVQGNRAAGISVPQMLIELKQIAKSREEESTHHRVALIS